MIFDTTIDESWTLVTESGHFYAAQARFVFETLGHGGGRCLVAGSPCIEAIGLAERGWSVTYADLREPPAMPGVAYLKCDLTLDSLPADTFDVASSTCVLCHVGTGRYGDSVCSWADLIVLRNIYQSLRTGSAFALTWGPVALADKTVYDSSHRVYCIENARNLASEAGFSIVSERVLDTRNQWKNDPDTSGRDYLSMLLKK